MKLVTFRSGKNEQVGALTDDGQVVELPAFASMEALIAGGERALDTVRELAAKRPDDSTHPLDSVKLLAPLPCPPQMRDFLCFEKHLRQAFDAIIMTRAAQAEEPEEEAQKLRDSGLFDIPEVWYRQPTYYKCNRFAVTGPDSDVVWPGYSDVIDYELEFAAVIGKRGTDIPRDQAADHIFGYTIFNDFSARDAQAVEMEGRLGPAKGKDFDGANVLGPCIVTADEIGNPYELEMTARINGEEWSRGNSRDMYYEFEDLIAYVTQSETLHPGEVLGSGTVGNGCGLEQGKYLQRGDTVELEVDKIGVLRNRVT